MDSKDNSSYVKFPNTKIIYPRGLSDAELFLKKQSHKIENLSKLELLYEFQSWIEKGRP